MAVAAADFSEKKFLFFPETKRDRFTFNVKGSAWFMERILQHHMREDGKMDFHIDWVGRGLLVYVGTP